MPVKSKLVFQNSISPYVIYLIVPLKHLCPIISIGRNSQSVCTQALVSVDGGQASEGSVVAVCGQQSHLPNYQFSAQACELQCKSRCVYACMRWYSHPKYLRCSCVYVHYFTWSCIMHTLLSHAVYVCTPVQHTHTRIHHINLYVLNFLLIFHCIHKICNCCAYMLHVRVHVCMHHPNACIHALDHIHYFVLHYVYTNG